MRTPEEWSKLFPATYLSEGTVRVNCVTEVQIKQIQLDAQKQGMIDAAKVALSLQETITCRFCAEQTEKAIITRSTIINVLT